ACLIFLHPPKPPGTATMLQAGNTILWPSTVLMNVCSMADKTGNWENDYLIWESNQNKYGTQQFAFILTTNEDIKPRNQSLKTKPLERKQLKKKLPELLLELLMKTSGNKRKE